MPSTKHAYLVTVMVTSDTPINFVPFEDIIVSGRVINVVEQGKPVHYGLSSDSRALSKDEE